MRADVAALPSLLVAGRAIGYKRRPAGHRVAARLAKRRHALGDQPFSVGIRLGQVGGERRHASGVGFREIAFYLRIQQQSGRCHSAFHCAKQRLGPSLCLGKRPGERQLQIGRRLAKRLGQANTNRGQMRPAPGHGQAQ